MNARAAVVVIALIVGVICVNTAAFSQPDRKISRDYTPPGELVSIAPTISRSQQSWSSSVLKAI